MCVRISMGMYVKLTRIQNNLVIKVMSIHQTCLSQAVVYNLSKVKYDSASSHSHGLGQL